MLIVRLSYGKCFQTKTIFQEILLIVCKYYFDFANKLFILVSIRNNNVLYFFVFPGENRNFRYFRLL